MVQFVRIVDSDKNFTEALRERATTDHFATEAAFQGRRPGALRRIAAHCALCDESASSSMMFYVLDVGS